MDITAIINARLFTEAERAFYLGDRRGVSLAARMIDNLRKIKGVGNVIVALPFGTDRRLLQELGAEVEEGPEDPVQRLFYVADKNGLRHVLRVPGNAPFINIPQTEDLIASHLSGSRAMSYVRRLPAGMAPEALDVEKLHDMPGRAEDNYFSLKASGGDIDVGLPSGGRYSSASLKVEDARDLLWALPMAEKNAVHEKDPASVLSVLCGHIEGAIADAEVPAVRRYLNRRLNATEEALGRVDTRSAPPEVWVDIHNLCNLACKTCPQSLSDLTETEFQEKLGMEAVDIENFPLFTKEEGRYRKKPVVMDEALFAQLREALFNDIDFLSFGAYGEPLMNKKLPEFVNQSSVAGIRTHLITNGMLLNEKMADRLLDNGLRELSVSVDAVSKPLLEEIRRGVDHEKVMNAIRYIGQRVRGDDGFLFKVIFTAARENIGELPLMVREAASAGVDELHILSRYISPFMEEGQSLYYYRDETAKQVEKACHLAEKAGVKLVSSPQILSLMGTASGDTGCATPWKGAYISPTGTVHPCRCFYHKQAGTVGGSDIREIWRSDVVKEVRRGLLGSGPVLSACHTCLLGLTSPPKKESFILR